MLPITIQLPEPYIRALDLLVERESFPNRSEAIRSAIRDLIKQEKIDLWDLKHPGEKRPGGLE